MYFVVHYYMLEKECLLAFFFFLSITLREALHEHSLSQAGSLSEAFRGLSGAYKNSDLSMKEVTYV